MRVTLDFMFILVLTSVCRSEIIIKYRQTYKGVKTYYKLTGMTYDFNSAINWCHGLGGQLPIVLTQDELDFLADEVIVRNDGAMTDSKTTWMGLKKEKGHCFNWLDGTRVNMFFNYLTRCELCTAPCCAMYMWNDRNHKKMGFRDCNLLAKAVCVFDEEKTVLPKDYASLTKLYGELNGSLKNLSQKTENNFDQIKVKLNETESQLMKLQNWVNDHVNIKTETMKEIEYLKKSSSTSMILHWTSLTVIGCLILTLGFICYRKRRSAMPIPENSVVYVADENRLNFNHPDPNNVNFLDAPANNVNRKVNNLQQVDKDGCGAP